MRDTIYISHMWCPFRHDNWPILLSTIWLFPHLCTTHTMKIISFFYLSLSRIKIALVKKSSCKIIEEIAFILLWCCVYYQCLIEWWQKKMSCKVYMETISRHPFVVFLAYNIDGENKKVGKLDFKSYVCTLRAELF